MSTFKVGILHSLSGTMAKSEKPLVDASLLAIDEINSTGGILGNRIEPIIEDGASDPAIFIEKANKLIQKDKITTIFGCWTSFARKAIKPIIEKSNSLLWYPVQYEGLESSKNIIYTGSCLNQQIYPAVRWLLKNQNKRFFLLGSDYVFPITANKFIKAQLRQENCQILAEEYKPLGTNDFTDIISQIKKVQPDVIFNTLNGDSNFSFYRQYHKAGISYKEIPIVAVSIAEEEVQEIKEAAQGHYACWSYFQSIKTRENEHFVSNFKKKYGSSRVTSDPMVAAYTQLYLWKGTVETANSFNISELCQNTVGQTFSSPQGEIRIEPNNHVTKNAHIGQVLSNGQFEIIWSSENEIKPLPWFGLEELDFKHSKLAIDLLSEVSEGIQYSWILEQKTRALEKSEEQLKNDIIKRKRAENVLHNKTELLKLLQEITITINEATDAEEAMQICIDKICAFIKWPVGHVYITDSTGTLIPSNIWYIEKEEQYETLRKITEVTSFNIGVGLPGRVLASGKPYWISDVTNEQWFLRTKFEKDIGIKAALAFPVSEREKVVAVLEFFSEEAKERDELLLEALSNLAVQVGRVTERKRAEKKLKKTNKELQDSLAKVKLLSGLIPICANCKSIRNDKGYYEQIESYIKDHSEAEFSHGICPDCVNKLYPELFDGKYTGKQQSND